MFAADLLPCPRRATSTGSLFMSNRLQQWGSGKYKYRWSRTKEMTPRPTADLAAWQTHACEKTPGFKVVVYDSGGSPNWWLSNWPGSTALIMTGDEMGRWGLKYRGRYWGPFGTDKESFFRSNSSSAYDHIMLPPTIRPWFRQYFDPKQQAAFGSETAMFMPLGSRVEFPNITTIKPASERTYVFSLMIAMTDNSRRKLVETLKNTALIPKERGFMHVAEQWVRCLGRARVASHKAARPPFFLLARCSCKKRGRRQNHTPTPPPTCHGLWCGAVRHVQHPEVTNAEYVPPEKYAEIMQDSVFTPCPKGRSLDTFRLYESIESGSIPVRFASRMCRQHRKKRACLGGWHRLCFLWRLEQTQARKRLVLVRVEPLTHPPPRPPAAASAHTHVDFAGDRTCRWVCTAAPSSRVF